MASRMSARQMLDVVLAALVVEAREAGVDGDICSFSAYPGEGAALDYASCGGMAWVRLGSAFETDNFPQQRQNVRGCAYGLAIPMEVAIMRSIPLAQLVLGKSVDLPSEEENTAAAGDQADDMELMYRALRRASKDLPELQIGTYSPMGPSGGTVGGMWTFTAGNTD